MTLSGKYQQYNLPGLESKANGIRNFSDDDDHGLQDDGTPFSEVYYNYDLQNANESWLFLPCGMLILFVYPPTQKIYCCQVFCL
jgi:hypothetical protein